MNKQQQSSDSAYFSFYTTQRDETMMNENETKNNSTDENNELYAINRYDDDDNEVVTLFVTDNADDARRFKKLYNSEHTANAYLVEHCKKTDCVSCEYMLTTDAYKVFVTLKALDSRRAFKKIVDDALANDDDKVFDLTEDDDDNSAISTTLTTK